MKLKLRTSAEKDGLTLIYKLAETISSRVDIGNAKRLSIANIAKQLNIGKKIFLLTQKSLPKYYVEEIENILVKEGYLVFIEILPDSEESKNIDVLVTLWQKLQELQFSRQDTIVALGGGALSDIAGFCASTYLRGINLILLPTTLLAQVDASIGGKTGINLGGGKNLAGTFYFPHAVIVDPDFLATLPEDEISSGMAEIVKYSLIEKTIMQETEYEAGQRSLFESIQTNFKDKTEANNPAFTQIITRCISMKLSVVIADPQEKRLRRSLNLGHTLGHAIEKASNYEISHGKAVSLGTVFACELANKYGLYKKDELESVKNLLAKMNLPVSLGLRQSQNMSLAKIKDALYKDKKSQNGSISYVLPGPSLGLVDLDKKINVDEILEFLQSFLLDN